MSLRKILSRWFKKDFISLKWAFIDFRLWVFELEDNSSDPIWIEECDVDIRFKSHYKAVPWYKCMFTFRIPSRIRSYISHIISILVGLIVGIVISENYEFLMEVFNVS